ncbi:MAG: phage tail tube protein [Bacteroidales bacterium]|jgi:predicted secreted protein
MPNAFSGVGTRFYRALVDIQDEYHTIAEVNSISGPGMTRDTIDVTSLDSTGGYREFITSFRDAGEISLSMNFTHDGYTVMKTDFEASAARYYKIVLPNTEQTVFKFAGFVTSCPIAIPMDDKVTADVTIKISGQVTFYAGSTTTTTTS